MKLDTVNGKFLVRESRHKIAGPSHDFQSVCHLIDVVPVSQQYLLLRFHSSEQVTRGIHSDRKLSVFSRLKLRYGPAVVFVDQLDSIADAKDGHTELEDGRVVSQNVRVVDASRTTRYNYTPK